jgi:hypothetical protein
MCLRPSLCWKRGSWLVSYRTMNPRLLLLLSSSIVALAGKGVEWDEKGLKEAVRAPSGILCGNPVFVGILI